MLQASRSSDIPRQFDEWAKTGVFEQLQVVLLDEVGAAGRIDLDRVSGDSFCGRSKGGLSESSARLGRYRWTIERTGAWLGGLPRLRIRDERGAERLYALVLLACSVICFQACDRHGGNDHRELVGACVCRYGCSLVTQTTKRRLLPW